MSQTRSKDWRVCQKLKTFTNLPPIELRNTTWTCQKQIGKHLQHHRHLSFTEKQRDLVYDNDSVNNDEINSKNILSPWITKWRH